MRLTFLFHRKDIQKYMLFHVYAKFFFDKKRF